MGQGSTGFAPEHGESVVREGKASHRRGIETVGGKLILTDRRLVFIPHRLNFSKDVYSVPVAAIRSAATGGGANGIKIEFAGGDTEVFVVFRRKTWVEAVRGAAGITAGG
jgi:hypothetical protein